MSESILYNPDRTSHSIHCGLNEWQEATSAITEPTFSAEHQKLIEELKSVVLTHLNDPAHQSIKSLRHPEHVDENPIFTEIHWRDIYHAHSHKTTVKPSTLDPRRQPGYQATYQALGPNVAEWRDYRWHQFLIDRKCDVKKAAIMLLDYVSWYVNFGVADLIHQAVCPFSDAVEQFYPERFHGIAKNGEPLLVGCAGKINVDAYLARSLPLEVAYLTQTYKLEVCQRACIEASHLAGKRHAQYTYIQDLEGCTWGHRPWVKQCDLVASSFYPESLSVSIVLNVPNWFSMLWSVLKTFLDERTQSKVDLQGSNFRENLLEYVAADQLPREWGGSCTCNEAINQSIHQANRYSNSQSAAGGCLPYCVKYDKQALIDAQHKQVTQLEADQTAQTMNIGARSSQNLTFEITKEMCQITEDGSMVTQFTLWWSIEMSSKDIELSVHWKQHGHSEEVVIVAPHYLSADSPTHPIHRGCRSFTVASEHDLGVATIRLNNHFSMFSSKQMSVKAGLNKAA